MDFLLGLLFWGGLLLLTLSWLSRSVQPRSRTHRPPSSGGPQQPPRTGTPSAWSAAGPPGSAPSARHDARLRAVEEQRLREEEAVSDGLVIGHFLTRDHYQRRIDDLEEHLDEVAGQQQRWAETAASGDEDHYDDYDDAEFDAMAGYGIEPWADELFDLDDED